jgi:membrane-associated phospholipid phosphatase
VCDREEIITTLGFINDKCYPDDAFSYKLTWPNYFIYDTNTNCGGTPDKTVNLSVDNFCYGNTDEGVDDPVNQGSYAKWNFVDVGSDDAGLGNTSSGHRMMKWSFLVALMRFFLQLWEGHDE